MVDPESSVPTLEKIQSLLEYATSAPSSHNTQPWLFRVSNGRIALHADRTRALPVNDPQDRELTISCGCALLNLRVAAARAGFAIRYDLLPDPDDRDLLAVIDIDCNDIADAEDAELFDSIRQRRTSRKRFQPRGVPDFVLHEISQAAAQEQAWLQVIDAGKTRQQAAGLVAEGDAAQWSDPLWRRELAAWMRPRRRGDGLAIPGLIVPVARMFVRTFNMGRGVGAKDRQLAEESPVLAVLGTAGDGDIDWLNAGQALQRTLLDAHARGLQASYLNQPVQVAPLRTRLQQLLDCNGYPQLLLRFGYPREEIPQTPRRRLVDVLEYPDSNNR